MAITDVAISESDVDDIRGVLQMALVYFQARDLQTAQVNLSANNPSQLTIELQRVLGRIDYYWGDYLIAKREAELDEDEEDYDEEETDEQETEEAEVDEDQELSANPLGTAKIKRQEGRRLTAEEL